MLQDSHCGPYEEAPGRAFVLPIKASSVDQPPLVLILGVSPRLPLDDDYRGFYDLLAAALSAALTTVRTREDERRQAKALAEIDRAKTTFFSNVSHEFRTPLTLMLGPLEESLARAASLPADENDRVALAYRNAQRLLPLVNSLLDFSRVEAGRVQTSFQPTDIAALTTELASNFRSATDRAGLDLVIEASPLGEPVYLDHDMWEKIVVLLSARAGDEAREGVEAGADDYLVKPFSARDLVERVSANLNLARDRREVSLRSSAARQALTLQLLEGERQTTDRAAMMLAASEAMGRYLQLDQVGFLDVADDESLGLAMGWSGGAEPLPAGRWLASAFTSPCLDHLRAGRTLAVADAKTEPPLYDLMLAPGGRQALLARMKQAVLVDPGPFLHRIQAPVLLMWGERDAMIPVANSRDYLRALPDARLVSFPDLGHVPQEEAPVKSLEPLRAFLARDGVKDRPPPPTGLQAPTP